MSLFSQSLEKCVFLLSSVSSHLLRVSTMISMVHVLLYISLCWHIYGRTRVVAQGEWKIMSDQIYGLCVSHCFRAFRCVNPVAVRGQPYGDPVHSVLSFPIFYKILNYPTWTFSCPSFYFSIMFPFYWRNNLET